MNAIVNLLLVGGFLYVGYLVLNELGSDTGGG